MCRVRWLGALALLLIPGIAQAIQLHWSSGADTLTFTEATRCMLVVQADSAEVALPAEWRLLWVGDSTEVAIVALDSAQVCEGDTAQVYDLDEPATPEDSTAHRVTARFCSGGSSAAEQATFLLDLPAWGRGKLKVVALDPADSSAVIESNEVTFNGGVSDPYPSVILSAMSVHQSLQLRVTAIGTGLLAARSLSIVATDSSWSLPLDITSQSDVAVTATASVAAIVPACVVEASANRGVGASAPLAGDVAVGFLAPQSSPSPMIEHFSSDSVDTLHMQPRDFSMTWALNGLHIFYIRHDMATIQKFGTDLGTKYTEKNLGHVWTADFVAWHWDSLPRDTTVLQVDTLSTRWDNWHVWAPSIVRKQNDITYRMFYTGVQRVGGVGGVEHQSIGVATSTDLVHWNRQNAPVLTVFKVKWTPKGGSGAQQLRDPFVMEYPAGSGDYLMYFVARDSATSNMAVGVARSSDLSNWTADSLPLANTEFGVTESPHIFPDKGLWWLFFTTGNDPVRLQTTDLAHSPADPIASDWDSIPAERLYDYLYQDSTVAYWHASEHLAVAPHEYLAGWDDLHLAIEFSELVWYPTPGAPRPYHFALGSVSTAGVGGPARRPTGAPLALVVTQLQPGLPGVKLRVELPSPAAVRLQVYDVMGRRRRTLLDGALPAGATAVAWDGRDGNGAMVGYGVYFVRFSCGRAQRAVKVPLFR
jgi:hypothetical protein